MFIIDRFEDMWAVIEYGRKTFNLPKSLLPPGAKEGDVIKIAVTVDHDETQIRAQIAEKLAQELIRD